MSRSRAVAARLPPPPLGGHLAAHPDSRERLAVPLGPEVLHAPAERARVHAQALDDLARAVQATPGERRQHGGRPAGQDGRQDIGRDPQPDRPRGLSPHDVHASEISAVTKRAPCRGVRRPRLAVMPDRHWLERTRGFAYGALPVDPAELQAVQELNGRTSGKAPAGSFALGAFGRPGVFRCETCHGSASRSVHSTA